MVARQAKKIYSSNVYTMLLIDLFILLLEGRGSGHGIGVEDIVL